MALSRVGEQLELDFPELLAAARRIPWSGVSPRALTRGYERGILKAQAAKSMSEFVDPEQRDFWLPEKKAPAIYAGAPLLFLCNSREW